MEVGGNPQNGLSLIEVLLSVFLSALLMAAVLPMVNHFFQLSYQEKRQMESRQAARFAMDYMVRQMRYTSYVYLPVENGSKSGIANFQAPDINNPTGEMAKKKSIIFLLGNSQGENKNTIYRSVPGTSQPLTEETVANLSFSRNPLSPREITIEFDILDKNSKKVVGHLRTTVLCLNLVQS
ncbi:hypothetical protein P22_0151 [Propionispora sp. 2/2-37]|uniref:PilW family protein n=1 Tax=Propionispora sp. 2/2-37 TaxID=1677858 RepID=UPI0006BB5647|nr:prepilin-type N-terminal cleavage/methylation domain-containing protein [Propionispora sp. 2/2-37]CUH94089.1 hypothetical protein P22_0151 [Propionispora sp. 2/2-37]